MLQRIRERSYLVKGSPNTLLYESCDKVYTIDPGSELERGKLITNEVTQNLKSKKIEVLLTHAHSDHVAALATLNKNITPYISEQEISSLIDIKTRKALTYSSSVPSNILYRFVDYAPERFNSFKLGSKIDEIETIDLRGHSLGHAGFLTSDGVLYTGDSFFGDKLIAAVGVPYYLNYEDAVSSLKKLKEVISKDFVVVMAHGPVMKYKEALNVLEMNIKLMDEIKEKVLSFSGLTAEEITYKLLKATNVNITESSLVLSSVTIKSILGYLMKEGFLQTKVSERGIIWLRKSR